MSNTWVIYLVDWDNSWKRLLIPDNPGIQLFLSIKGPCLLRDCFNEMQASGNKLVLFLRLAEKVECLAKRYVVLSDEPASH